MKGLKLYGTAVAQPKDYVSEKWSFLHEKDKETGEWCFGTVLHEDLHEYLAKDNKQRCLYLKAH